MPALLWSLPFVSGGSFKPHITTTCHRGRGWSHTGSPESIFYIHYQQHNKGCLTLFDFGGPRNVFKLLIECGSHLLLVGKTSVCQGSSTSSIWGAVRPPAFEARSRAQLLENLGTFYFGASISISENNDP